MKLLEELGAIQAHQQSERGYILTDIGRQLAQLPVDPRLARMVIEARKLGAVRETMVIVAALSIQDPRERPLDKQQAADEKHRRFHDKQSDFLAFLNLWDYLKSSKPLYQMRNLEKCAAKIFELFTHSRVARSLYSIEASC